MARPLRAASSAAALLLTLAAGAEAQAPATIRGRIVDAVSGAPLAGANVQVLGAAAAARSDADGTWHLATSAGAQRIRIRFIGFATREVELSLAAGADTTVTVALTPAALALDQVVVTASRREQRLKDVAVTTELVGRHEIARTGAADLAAVLTEQSGIQLEGGHPTGAGLMLQGLGSERVLVLLDGQPLIGRISGSFDVSRIPTSIVERVEIVKGPQATLYGSEAMGGVINIITRDAQPGVWSGTARLAAGSEGRLEGGASGSFARDAFSATADIGQRAVERTPGRADEAGALAERTDGAAKLRWSADSSLALEASVLALDERQRWKSGPAYEFADNTQISARVGASWSAGAHRLSPTLYLSRFDHLQRTSAYTDPIANTGDRQVQRLAEAELLYGTRLGGHALDAGLEVKQEYITSSDGRVGEGSRTMYSAEPFAQYEIAGDRWTVVPGARLSWNEQWGTHFTPRVAVRLRVADPLTLRASVGGGFRAPEFKELYLDFTNDAANYAVYGNPDLRPETSTNAAAGAEWSTGRFYARGQLFVNALRDFIETRPIANDGGTLTLYRYANVSRSTTAGGELETGTTLGPLRAEAAYSYLHTRDHATDEPLLGRPTHSGRASLGYSARFGLNVMATSIYTGRAVMERATATSAEGVRDGFLRFDLHLAQQLPMELELTLGVDNLLDERPDEWAGAVGRQVYTGLSWNITRSTR